MMRVLRVIGSMDPKLGGPAQAVRSSIPALERSGVHNEVVSLDDPEAPYLKLDPFKTHALGPASGPWKYGSKLFPWLISNIPRFDVVIVEGLWQYYGHATAQAFRELKRRQTGASPARLLVMSHGMLDPYFQKAKERRLKAMRNWFYWKLIESKVVNHADGLLFTCEEERLLARQPFRPYHPKREFNIGLGIEHPPALEQSMRDAFRSRCPQLGDASYILFLGRIHEKKGVDLLVDAYAKTVNSRSRKLVIAGPGLDTPFGSHVKDLVDRHGLAGQILFPGMLSGASKWGAFYGCEAFVLPSHQENFGIAVVEALACSKPVLISNQVNIWREIVAENAGVAEPDTMEGTERLLRRWAEFPQAEVSKMTERARQAFQKLYAVETAVPRMMDMFNEVRSTNR